MEVDSSTARRKRHSIYELVPPAVPSGGNFKSTTSKGSAKRVGELARRTKATTIMAGILVEGNPMERVILEKGRGLGRRLARRTAKEHTQLFIHLLAAEHQAFTTVEERRESAEKKEMK